MDPKDGLDIVAKRNIFAPAENPNPNVQFVKSLY
jgi:hypothetical protein